MTRDEWLALGERLEKATGPDRGLSDALAVCLGYSAPCGDTSGSYVVTLPGEKPYLGHAPHYTASLDAITSRIERELPGCGISSRCGPVSNIACSHAIIWHDDYATPYNARGTAATEPLALCAALCRVKAEMTNASA